jgi:beta-phosphoglucomutase-like phosphatase (HAD superfamily)
MPCVLFDLDGTLHDSERLASEGSDYILKRFLNRDLSSEERQYLIGAYSGELGHLIR